MKLDQTRRVIHEGVDQVDPVTGLIQVLEAAVELINIPDNDFAWSSWQSAEDARSEVVGLINRIKNGDLPERLEVSVLFAPTGPLQEVSLSSGWADPCLKVAERFDSLEHKIWTKG